MTPQTENVNHYEAERQVSVLTPTAPIRPPQQANEAPTFSTATAPHALTETERQGLAMGWVSIALGLFLLLGGLALWAAWALGAGFSGWLLGIAVMGIVVVATLVAIYFLVARRRG